MVSKEVEMKLYNAASSGDLTTLVQLLEEDPYLVHGVSFPCSRNLLHVTAIHGQTSIVEQVLKLNPQLARISDSEKSSPLHIAAAGGHVEIASKLLSVAPEMCWRRDDQGMNPIHVAAMNGHVEILEILLLESCMPAMERLHRGQPVLHLCVKHAQLRALKVLVEKLGELVCAKDDDGDTLLHLAARCGQLETIEYLVENKALNLRTRNAIGKTAHQILKEIPRTTVNYSKMENLLTDFSIFIVIPKMTNSIMVVLVLIATMAYQSVINPPGGVWAGDDDKSSHKAGEAVMASTHPDAYINFMNANFMAFICSITAMFLFTIKVHKFLYPFMFMLTFIVNMGMALLSIMGTFLESMYAITPDELMKSKGNNILLSSTVWLSIFGLMPVCAAGVRHLYRWWVSEQSRQQVDLGADAFPLRLRLLYWTSQHLDMPTIFRALR
ncbi:ankyrin repeat-containing protein ITN1-like [Salvia hispanica]|uniref:ankyrin repeat-containing protein ITN1-like n=1 Tax=Salvia hispanica TaxID=49212 RepID=UPI0020093CD1|nr:ankyrin repeat-containing protein ITN1-like [Salvia hispanica]